MKSRTMQSFRNFPLFHLNRIINLGRGKPIKTAPLPLFQHNALIMRSVTKQVKGNTFKLNGVNHIIESTTMARKIDFALFSERQTHDHFTKSENVFFETLKTLLNKFNAASLVSSVA